MENIDYQLEEVLEVINMPDFLELDIDRALRLQNEDINNQLEQAGPESGDSDLEIDHEEECAVSNIVKIPKFGTQILEKLFCVTQSYVLVFSIVDNKERPLCNECYFIHQYYSEEGAAHYHVNTHIKRKFRYSKKDFKCHNCKRSLFQLTVPEVCIICTPSKKETRIDEATNCPKIP